MAARKKSYENLPEIGYGTRPKVLLVGNGISLPFSGAQSVDQIIQNEWKNNYHTNLPSRKDPLNHHSIWDQPFPLQIVLATKDHVSSCMEKLAQEFKNLKVEPEQQTLIKKILDAKFDAILSTNYSLEIEKSIMPGASDRKIQRQYVVTKKQNTQQELFGIYQGTKISYANNPILWHIHGTVFRKNSLVMGQYYYGKLLSEVVQRANYVVKSYKDSIKRCAPYKPESWVDYFLIGDIYCMGFSMALSESDIWWLVALKKSAFSETSFTLFEREKSEGIKSLLYDAYEIKRPDVSALRGINYVEFYENICAEI